MRDLCHPNVVALIGLSYINDNFCIILEWMSKGCLKSYLRSSSPFSVEKQFKFCHDISAGMAYLAERKFFHRDLAARNCLLSSELDVKIADFGLSKEGSKLKGGAGIGHFTRQKSIIWDLPMPLRWMSPESVEHRYFDESTDVWSFGITIWEIMSGGKTPFSNIKWDHKEQFLKQIKGGLQPEKIGDSSPELNKTMQSCLHINKWERPSFLKLQHIFEKSITSNSG